MGVISPQTLEPLIKSCTNPLHLLQLQALLLRTSSHHHQPSLLRSFLSSASSLLPPILSFSLFSLLRHANIRPDPFSSSSLLHSTSRLPSLPATLQLHSLILRSGFLSDCVLLSNLLKAYSSCGHSRYARKVFDEMPQRDVVTWNILISCYTRNKRTRDALQLFEEMQTGPGVVEPDDVTCLLLLQACAQLGAGGFGRRIHDYIDERGYGGALKLQNSLVAMYSKCGCMEDAVCVFRGIAEKNVVSWSVMISGLAKNGLGKEALEAFGEMRRAGVAPDEQTFTGLLSACSHGGLVFEGLRIFEMMEEYSVVPNVRHYGCMVDLLGRAGLLDQAYHFIVSMVDEPDSTIWRTLLGACRVHGHVALGDRVVMHLIELKAQEAGDYVLLLNMYASVGNWEKVANVRSLMKEKGIQTTPGCSTMELNGEVHEFVVDDDSHPQKVEIYEMLDEINKQLKIAGYIADMTAELHNLDAQGKECMLTYHSEKLAIAFGMMSTPPGTKLTIAKNLRMCIDCHTFVKFLSSVYNRTVVIRDRYRFHHFRGGLCSCNDYW